MKQIKKRIILFTVLLSSFIYLAGCNLKPAAQIKLPLELTVEEYPLKEPPTLDPLTFTPVNGTQADILLNHEQDRGNSFPDNTIFLDNQPGFSVQLGNEKIIALESFANNVTDQGTFQKATVQVSRDGETIYSIQAGDSSPINPLQGLWVFSNHWVLEIAHVTLQTSSQNDTPLDVVGQIIQDGKLLNDRFGYEEAFNFQLMKGKPFYFFKRDGQIGISYDNQEVQLGYTQIPHYQCCSAAELNPKSTQNQVAFFAQRDREWYYVEIGVYK